MCRRDGIGMDAVQYRTDVRKQRLVGGASAQVNVEGSLRDRYLPIPPFDGAPGAAYEGAAATVGGNDTMVLHQPPGCRDGA